MLLVLFIGVAFPLQYSLGYKRQDMCRVVLRFKAGQYYLGVALFFCSSDQYFSYLSSNRCSSTFEVGCPLCFRRDLKILMFLSNVGWNEFALRRLRAS